MSDKEMFPGHTEVTPDVIQDFKNKLVHCVNHSALLEAQKKKISAVLDGEMKFFDTLAQGMADAIKWKNTDKLRKDFDKYWEKMVEDVRALYKAGPEIEDALDDLANKLGTRIAPQPSNDIPIGKPATIKGLGGK